MSSAVPSPGHQLIAPDGKVGEGVEEGVGVRVGDGVGVSVAVGIGVMVKVGVGVLVGRVEGVGVLRLLGGVGFGGLVGFTNTIRGGRAIPSPGILKKPIPAMSNAKKKMNMRLCTIRPIFTVLQRTMIRQSVAISYRYLDPYIRSPNYFLILIQ